MAFTAASLSPFSSLSISTTTPRLSLLPPKPTFSFPPKPSPSPLRFAPIRASDDENDPNQLGSSDPEEEELDPNQLGSSDPEDGYEEEFDEEEFRTLVDAPDETEEEIAAAYEAIYGPAYSGVSYLGNDVNVMDEEFNRMTRWEGTETVRDRPRDGLEERIVQVRRVTKVVKGGKNMQFRAIVVVGDLKGHVGVGVGKGKEMADAVYKSGINARRNMIKVPLTKYNTFPHRADGRYGAATVMLRPACPGSGLTAGGVVRVVLEVAGVQNAQGKQLRSKNILNNARATIAAVQKMRQFSEVAEARGLPMELLWQ